MTRKQNNGLLPAATVPRLAGWLAIEQHGFIQQSRIVGVGSVKTASMRRLLQATPPASLVVLTGGRRRQTAVLLDSGHVVITALTLAEWRTLLMREA